MITVLVSNPEEQEILLNLGIDQVEVDTVRV